MTVNAVKPPPTVSPSFELTPVVAPAMVPAKPPRRGMLKQVQRAMLPAYLLTTLAAVGLTGVTSAVVWSGMAATTVERHQAASVAQVDGIMRERTALALREANVAAHEKRLVEAQGAFDQRVSAAVTTELEQHRAAMTAEQSRLDAERGAFTAQLDALTKSQPYDAPARLVAMRTAFNKLAPEELAELTTLAARASARGVGFVKDPSAYATADRVQIAPSDVARMLATTGRLYVGHLEAVYYSNNPVQMLNQQRGVETITTLPALKSYLTMFRDVKP